MRKFNLKHSCYTLLLTFLLSLPLNVLDCGASSISFSVESEDEIIGYASDLDMTFSALSEENMIKVILQFNGKEMIVQVGYGEREGEISIEGYSMDSGDITTLTTDDINVLETLMLEIDINDDDLGKTFIRTLNLLNSWPPNLPLFSHRDVLGVWPFVRNICGDYGELHLGVFIYLIIPTFVVENVGGEDCFGRCGKGCIGDGGEPFQNELNIYTQDCFLHDGCVRRFGLLNPVCNLQNLQ